MASKRTHSISLAAVPHTSACRRQGRTGVASSGFTGRGQDVLASAGAARSCLRLEQRDDAGVFPCAAGFERGRAEAQRGGAWRKRRQRAAQSCSSTSTATQNCSSTAKHPVSPVLHRRTYATSCNEAEPATRPRMSTPPLLTNFLAHNLTPPRAAQ